MGNIDLRSLEIFRAVVHEGGVLRAAEKLNRVQSNVTTSIKQLERKLGVSLFRRSGRSLVLTDAGRTLLAYAERLLKLAEEAEGVTKGKPDQGPFRIGAMESTAASRLPKLLSNFHRQYPDIQLVVETGTSDDLRRKVAEYRLEAAFIGEPCSLKGLQALSVFSEKLVLISAKGQKVVKSPTDIATRTLLTFAKGCSYRKRFEDWFASHSMTVDRVMELSSYQAIIACAAAGTGCGIVPAATLDTLHASQEIERHALPKQIAKSTTHLVWAGDASPKLKLLVDLLSTRT